MRFSLATGASTTVGSVAWAKDTTWSGSTGAQVYLQAPDRDPAADGNQGWDLSGYLSSGGVLAFDAKVNGAPAAAVKTRIDCGYPCMGELDATALFTDATLGDGNAHTFKIPLSCFQSAGTDFAKINTPFLLSTAGAFELTFADVRWLPGDHAGTGVATCSAGVLSPPAP